MAGTWSSVTSSRGQVNGQPSDVHERSKTFIDDDTTVSIPDTVFDAISGFLVGARVAFGTTPPDTITLTIKDKNGVELTSGTFTAAGLFEITSPIPFSEGLTISGTGNTTVSAEATIYLYFIV